TNRPPLASFTVNPTKGDTSTVFAFDGSKSRDPDGTVKAWAWDFQDGSHREFGAKVEHQFKTAGTFKVGLTVTDNKGVNGNLAGSVKVDKSTAIVCTQKPPFKRIGIFGTVTGFDGDKILFKTDTHETCAT